MAEQQIIVKRVEDEHHDEHHGGGWKVAYADFMTAMMAFFLMLWILNSADADKLKGIAQYFTPIVLDQTGGGPGFLKGDTLASDGALVGAGSQSETPPALPSFGQESPLRVFDSRLRYEQTADAPSTEVSDTGEAAEGAAAETGTPEAAPVATVDAEAAFDTVAREIETALNRNQQFEALSRNVRIDRTPEGLEVQIVDDAGQSMFDSGSARVGSRTRAVIESIGAAIAELPNPVVITGHTDAVPFVNSTVYDNWELSSDRALATRRVLIAAGLDPVRIRRVAGMADNAPLVQDPQAPENRRISVMLLHSEPPSE